MLREAYKTEKYTNQRYMSLELKATLPTTNRHFRSIRSNKQMTKIVITFRMSFVIHGISTLKAVRGLFELVRFYQEKQKRFYYVYYPDQTIHNLYIRGADKSIARPTSQCIFYGENILFDDSLVIYIYIYIYI